jgi:hypothetical protein
MPCHDDTHTGNFLSDIPASGILHLMNLLLNLSSAFGLSGAAGLNAYIPLFFVALLANRGLIHLGHPYDILGHTWCMVVLGILCLMEFFIDKIPGIDHVNDALQTLVRPTAGALLFASQMGLVTHMRPELWIVLGLLMAGSIHAAKTAARPVVNMSTLGVGGPVVSAVEDLMSTVVSLLALLAPVFCVLVMVVLGWICWKMFIRLKNRRRPLRVEAVPVREGPFAASAT